MSQLKFIWLEAQFYTSSRAKLVEVESLRFICLAPAEEPSSYPDASGSNGP